MKVGIMACDLELVGSRLKELRALAGVSQEQLAYDTRMSPYSYRNWERGRNLIPVEYALILAEHYDVSLSYIYVQEENDEKPRSRHDDLITLIDELPSATQEDVRYYVIHLHKKHFDTKYVDLLEQKL